jgi:hypothetical protein
MKTCSYCGRQEATALACPICGTELVDSPVEKGLQPQIKPAKRTLQIDLADIDPYFEMDGGFSRPDWKGIRAFLDTRFPKENQGEAWESVAEKWLEKLARDLGGDSGVYESQHFFALSDIDHDKTERLLGYRESVLTRIRDILAETAWSGYYGKHVLLLFSDADDYYAYISFYYPEGVHALTGGVFVRKGYAHIALPYMDLQFTEHVLVHELVHNLLCHLPIPTWLNEGLATLIEQQSLRRPFVLDEELVERHTEHWNAQNIQAFWAGASFGVPGDDSELSYSLAWVLVKLLSEKGNFRAFVANADWRDAGQNSASTVLNCDLGEIAGTFLGAGDWRPQRKSIAAISKKYEDL